MNVVKQAKKSEVKNGNNVDTKTLKIKSCRINKSP